MNLKFMKFMNLKFMKFMNLKFMKFLNLKFMKFMNLNSNLKQQQQQVPDCAQVRFQMEKLCLKSAHYVSA